MHSLAGCTVAGSFKACISPLVAEQYDVTALRVKTLKNGERVIVDPAFTTAQYVSLLYLDLDHSTGLPIVLLSRY